MAKARRKSIPIDERTVGELSEAELNEMMQRAFQKDLRDHPERWAAARAEAAILEKGRKALDRAMAISDGRIAPQWARELITQLKPPPPVETRSPKNLITAEVNRRVEAGERWDSITKLSRSLNTVDGLRHLKARTIENRLREGHLWPLPSKK